MLSNIAKSNFLLRGKSALLKRYNVPLTAQNIRHKWNTVSSKNQNATMESEDDDTDQPIKYSTSKAANMRIDEYRDPVGDTYPWYQGYIVSLSIAVFLGYFCILREENDIDLMLHTDLGESLKTMEKKLEEEKKFKS
ncbi:uncharacterized protein LOC105208132 [Solenopsis invicta]|uniref:uncharacterized protein LOC105208132 n=1 Tax=Solenopsis invicta TaxID=13686 RepID=UPI0001FEB87B|nr:uncharacterized protein LOC105208132 [Solenopsis invicta]